ncbi:MAG: hypothetical protein GF403_05875 [Candidatus Coatesbacteria bacterium]|nr:hypothetical protein [Candidatus Coatesbacteria bacterium]
MRNEIRGRDGRLIAYREEHGGRIVLRGSNGILLGFYDVSGDRTYDASGCFVATGDALGTLIDR